MMKIQQLYRTAVSLGFRSALALATCVSGLLAQGVTQEQFDGQDERIAELEEALMALEDQSFEEEFGVVDIHGFLGQGYINSSRNNYLGESSGGSWAYNEMGTNFAVDLTDKVRTGIQIFSRDLGPDGNGRFVVDWAMVDYRHSDNIGLRFGKVKVPHGLYNETRDVDTLRNSILLPGSVYNETFRTTMAGLWGVGIYGGFSSDQLGRLDYQAQIGTVPIEADDGIARTVSNAAPFTVNSLEMDYTFSAGLRWTTPVPGLLLSVTTLEADVTAEGPTTTALGVLPVGTPVLYGMEDVRYSVFSAEYTLDDLVIAAEYWSSTLSISLDADLPSGSIPLSDSTLRQEGYYMSAAQRINDWFEIGAYYSVYYPDSEDRTGIQQVNDGAPDFTAWMKDTALTLRFDIDDSWVFKLEGHSIDGVGSLFASENPGGFSQRWTMFLAKLSVSF